MRLNYYRFPDGTSETILLKEGCSVILKSGSEIWPENIPEDKRELVDHVNDIIGPLTITTAKDLMKKYGGSAWTEHYERDGGLFEVTEITLKGNNSRFKYNHHL